MQDQFIVRIPLQISQNCVVASIQVDLDTSVIHQFRADLLRLLESSNATAVILDVSGVMVMDLLEFEAIKETIDMARLMGARSILAGLQPGVVSSLVELDADLDGLEAALNLDDAFQRVADYRATSAVVDQRKQGT